MNQILNHLTINHFKNGWSIYWRIAIPFWAHLLYVVLIFTTTLFLQDKRLVVSLQKFIAGIVDYPFVLYLAVGGILYGLGYPFLRKLQRYLSNHFDSEFFRSQFSLFGSVDKFNRAINGFLAAFAIFLIYQWESFFTGLRNFWIWFFLTVVLLLGVMAFFVALYGWLADQFDDVKKMLIS